MKKIILFFLLYSASLSLFSQTIIYNEDFESSSQQVSNVGTGTSSWSVNTRLQCSGLNCDSATITNINDNPILETTTFSSTGYNNIVLEFTHICHLNFFDGGIVEVSVDNGNTWIQLHDSLYLGNASYLYNSNQFNTNSYPQFWHASNYALLPDNQWWQTETFDISSIAANKANVKIRFSVNDLNSNGIMGFKGWYLDDIKVTAALDELIPPTINDLSSIVSGLGPFHIIAEITDQSNIDTAILYYNINNGPQISIPMTVFSVDTLYAIIPAINNNDTLNYHIFARDLSICQNTATSPSYGDNQYIAIPNVPLLYTCNFDETNCQWYHDSINSTNINTWELGTSSFMNPISSPNVWGTLLNSNIDDYSTEYLYSPIFDFSQIIDAKINFNFYCDTYSYTSSNADGVTLEYTTDSVNWYVLGSDNDPFGFSWYNNDNVAYTNKPGWSGPYNTWQYAEYPLTILNNSPGQVQFRFVLTSKNHQCKGFYIDDFSISTPIDYDLKLLEISTPIVKDFYTASETIAVKIYNNGESSINFQNYPLSINIENTGVNPSVIPTYIHNNQIIFPGDTLDIIVTNTCDMGKKGHYSFNANISCSLDSNTFNDSIILSEFTNYVINEFPYTEDFDDFNTYLITHYEGWTDEYHTQSSYYDDKWGIDDGSSYNITGPRTDHTISSTPGNYAYFKGGSGDITDTALLISPYIILPNNINNTYRLYFWYHMFGPNIKNLILDICQNGIWQENLIVINGEQQESATDDWKITSLLLDSFEGDTIQIRFRCCHPTGNYGHIAIDDIRIEEIPPLDLKLVNISRLDQSSCFSNSETIFVNIVNNGLDSINLSNYPLTVNCSSTSNNAYNFAPIIINNGVLYTNDTINVIISNTYNMEASGDYYFDININCAADTSNINDTLVNAHIFNPNIDTFPYLIDFENMQITSYFLDPPPYWENTYGDYTKYSWRISKPSNYSLSGPRTDHTTGTSQGLLFKTQTYGINGDSTFLTSPCINLNYLTLPKLEFWSYLYGYDIGSLHLDIFSNGSWNKDIVVYNGQQQLIWTEPWMKFKMNLDQYANSIIKVRFRAYRGNGSNSIIAIDDFRIFDAAQKDIGVIEILEPVDILDVDSSFNFKTVVQNFGIDTIYNYDVYACQNNNLITSQSFTSNIGPYGLDTVSFNGFIALDGNNKISVYTKLTGDTILANDTSYKEYYCLPPVIYYSNNFDDPNNQIQQPIWSEWECGTPNGNIINNSNSGTNAWLIDLDNPYNPNLYDSINIPRVFNFSNIHGAALSLNHWDQTTNLKDICRVEYSTSFGSYWQILGTPNDSLGFNWYNGISPNGWSGTKNGWLESVYDLSEFDNITQPLQFRLVFISDSISENLDGIAFDDFSINVPKSNFDIGVVDIWDPINGYSVPGINQNVSITIKNFGLDTAFSSMIRLIDGSGYIYTEYWNGILCPDSTIDYTLTNSYLSPNNAHQITVLTYNYPDVYMFNDSITKNIQVGSRDKDIGITNINSPIAINNSSSILNVNVKIENFGLNDVSNFDICYSINNSPYICETYNGTLASGQNMDYIFNQTFSAPSNTFDFCVKTDLTDDIISSNNELCNTYSVGLIENYNSTFLLYNCRPNPVTNSAIIPIEINQSGIVKFDIYNNLGQIVYTKEYNFDAGENQIEFTTENFASGVYSYGVSYNESTKFGKFCK